MNIETTTSGEIPDSLDTTQPVETNDIHYPWFTWERQPNDSYLLKHMDRYCRLYGDSKVPESTERDNAIVCDTKWKMLGSTFQIEPVDENKAYSSTTFLKHNDKYCASEVKVDERTSTMVKCARSDRPGENEDIYHFNINLPELHSSLLIRVSAFDAASQNGWLSGMTETSPRSVKLSRNIRAFDLSRNWLIPAPGNTVVLGDAFTIAAWVYMPARRPSYWNKNDQPHILIDIEGEYPIVFGQHRMGRRLASLRGDIPSEGQEVKVKELTDNLDREKWCFVAMTAKQTDAVVYHYYTARIDHNPPFNPDDIQDEDAKAPELQLQHASFVDPLEHSLADKIVTGIGCKGTSAGYLAQLWCWSTVLSTNDLDFLYTESMGNYNESPSANNRLIV